MPSASVNVQSAPASRSKPESSIMRDRSGCITCRVRQKRCAGIQPGETDCSDCLRLNIQCLGFFKNRPDWLRNPKALMETKYRIKYHLTEYPAPRGRGPAPERPFLDFSDLIEQYTPRIPGSEASRPLFDRVTSDMSSQEMFECLIQHGCQDLSSSLNHGHYSSSPVANGGFGEIWRVTISNGLVLAVKTLRFRVLLEGDDKAAKRAAREVHHWSKLRHLNVQDLLGIIVFRGELGMVSPWMEYGNLKRYLAQHPDIPRYPLCIQLAEGVSYLHRVEMVHGDLKANNVLVADNGILKINDFDHAVLSDSTLRFSTTTRPGGGTLRWMAPELLQPEEEHDGEGEEDQPMAARSKESDIYALAMTMLEILTGRVPYAEYRSDMGIYNAIYTQKPPKRPKELFEPDSQATPMWDLLLGCWDHNPSDRPDAASVLRLLKGFVINVQPHMTQPDMAYHSLPYAPELAYENMLYAPRTASYRHQDAGSLFLGNPETAQFGYDLQDYIDPSARRQH